MVGLLKRISPLVRCPPRSLAVAIARHALPTRRLSLDDFLMKKTILAVASLLLFDRLPTNEPLSIFTGFMKYSLK
jgi:hypothetical protein